MAVPDPHMSEMTIMAYETRNGGMKYPVPRRNDYIDVLWCMDHLPGLPEKWCPAEVLHVSGIPGQDILASGVILYLPDDTWDEQTHTVEFLQNHTLCRAASKDANISDDEGGNPALTWRFSNDREDKQDSSDTEWVAEIGWYGDAIGRVKRQKAQTELRNEDIAALRCGHAVTTVEIQKLKREVAYLSSQFQQLKRDNTSNQACTGASCVLPRLRHKLMLKAQNSLRQMRASGKKRCHEDVTEIITLRTGDGLHMGIMKTKVECSLRQFEDLACRVQASSSRNTVFFYPHFEHTQQPLRCSDEFRILSSTFTDLPHHIGISSKSDRLEIARKCGSGPQGELLRLLGTYRYDPKDEKGVADIFPGASCGVNQSSGMESGKNQVDQQGAAQLHPVLVRKSREWNVIDRRFVHELRVDQTALPQLNESCSEDQAFQLLWRRAPDISVRSWSRATVESPHIHGWLEVGLPFVQTQGRHLCIEVGGLASDDVWDKIL